MYAYIIRRTLLAIPMMLGITLVSFFIIHLAPGSPTDMVTDLNPNASPQVVKKLRELYHLDEPVIVQYFLWLKDVAVLDFGQSFSMDARPVLDKILERMPVTISINLMELVLVFVTALPIGVLAATRRYSFFDSFTTVLVFLGFAMPTFWLALLMMMFFGVWLNWLPISGLTSIDHDSLSFFGKLLDYAKHLVMPMLAAGLTSLAGLSRFSRQNMLEVLRQDYVTTARAKGLAERNVIFKHCLKNAILPVVTILALSIPGLIGGSVIFETIFSIPGMGQLFYQAVMARDYPLIMGVLVMGSFLTLFANLLADVAYGVADPRIHYD